MIAGEHRLALPAGYQLGKYRFKEVLGAGGFGITYLAEDGSLGRRVAIKELLPNDIATRLDGSTVVAKTKSEEANLAWARDRFVKEGRALAACDHPNVVNVYEMIEANGTAYMVTKFEDGRSFAEWLKEVESAPTEKELRAILMPLLSGLEKVHKAGFLHRDLKPENIYLTDDGRPILLDFGSARQAITDRTTSLTSIVTAGYAPFEQYHEDGKQGAWTDLYALAAVLYRAIHGKKPPEATRRLKDDPCLDLSREYAGKYSARFLHALDKALSVEHARRPQSVAEWKQLLGAAPADDKIVPEPWWMAWLETAQTLWREKPRLVAGAAAGVLAIGLVAWKLLQPPPVPEPAIAVVTPAPEPPPAESPTPQPPSPQPPVANITTPNPNPVPKPEPGPPVAPPAVPFGIDPAPKKSTVWETFQKSEPSPEPPKAALGPRVGEKWTNSLGQVFAWAPGLPMHMAATETRRGDFEAFVRATGHDATAGVLSMTTKGWKAQGASWVNPGFAQSQTPAHPVVGVSAYDALAFCRWLTEKERAEGLIDARLAYRLPTDAEWGKALQEWRFPWGDVWPPTVGAGNYAGEELKQSWGSSRVIAGYRDGFSGTAPTGTFQANAAGFYDLGGNVVEMCGSWARQEAAPENIPGIGGHNSGAGRSIVLRGGSWITSNPELLQLSASETMLPHERYVSVGFRCILASAASQSAFVLPPLRTAPQDPPPGVAPAEGEIVEKRLVGTWESKTPAPTGTITWRWEQEADGAYTLAGPLPDAGRLTASHGRIQQQSEMTAVKTAITYRFKSSTQLVTNGPLGEAAWRRISSQTPALRAAAATADQPAAPAKEKSGDTAEAPSRSRNYDPPPKKKYSPPQNKPRDVINNVRRRFGF